MEVADNLSLQKPKFNVIFHN